MKKSLTKRRIPSHYGFIHHFMKRISKFGDKHAGIITFTGIVLFLIVASNTLPDDPNDVTTASTNYYQCTK